MEFLHATNIDPNVVEGTRSDATALRAEKNAAIVRCCPLSLSYYVSCLMSHISCPPSSVSSVICRLSSIVCRLSSIIYRSPRSVPFYLLPIMRRHGGGVTRCLLHRRLPLLLSILKKNQSPNSLSLLRSLSRTFSHSFSSTYIYYIHTIGLRDN